MGRLGDVTGIDRWDYAGPRLSPEHVPADPLEAFAVWFAEALQAEQEVDPHAMALATVDAGGLPDVRIVLLREHDARGLVFYTNLASVKARQLAAMPQAAVAFHWPTLHRQVRARGPVERVTEEEADAYFASRPRGSQLGAWASPQSQPLAGRDLLDTRLAEVARRFPGVVPRPPTWGGYRVLPVELELWQGQPDRLHDRVRYRRRPDAWVRERLAP